VVIVSGRVVNKPMCQYCYSISEPRDGTNIFVCPERSATGGFGLGGWDMAGNIEFEPLVVGWIRPTRPVIVDGSSKAFNPSTSSWPGIVAKMFLRAGRSKKPSLNASQFATSSSECRVSFVSMARRKRESCESRRLISSRKTEEIPSSPSDCRT